MQSSQLSDLSPIELFSRTAIDLHARTAVRSGRRGLSLLEGRAAVVRHDGACDVVRAMRERNLFGRRQSAAFKTHPEAAPLLQHVWLGQGSPGRSRRSEC